MSKFENVAREYAKLERIRENVVEMETDLEQAQIAADEARVELARVMGRHENTSFDTLANNLVDRQIYTQIREHLKSHPHVLSITELKVSIERIDYEVMLPAKMNDAEVEQFYVEIADFIKGVCKRFLRPYERESSL